MNGEGVGIRLDKREGTISDMFNEIAPRYDLINHLLSLNIDILWRRKVISFLKRQQEGRKATSPFKVIDIACGTGDSTVMLYKNHIAATGVDIAEGMLNVARAKTGRLHRGETPPPQYHNASAERLPFKDEEFAAAVICFGVRNFSDRSGSLKEIYRVIERGGNIAILEFAEPVNRVTRSLYSLYLKHLVPLIGGMISGKRSAYRYLSLSIENFPKYERFCKELSEAGFKEINYKALTGGIALLYTGKKS